MNKTLEQDRTLLLTCQSCDVLSHSFRHECPPFFEPNTKYLNKITGNQWDPRSLPLKDLKAQVVSSEKEKEKEDSSDPDHTDRTDRRSYELLQNFWMQK